MKRKLKQPVLYALYGIAFVLLVAFAFTLESILTPTPKENLTYVSKTNIDKVVKVEAENYKIIKPYNDSEIQELLSYYDKDSDEEEQKKSIIYFKNTYMQSSGIIYGGKDSFDIVAILDGKVTNVSQDELLGNIIEITHSNGMVSMYQSVDDIKVKVDDKVKQGDIIAKSGTNELNSELGSIVYFELIVNGSSVNPNNYYDKLVSEI